MKPCSQQVSEVKKTVTVNALQSALSSKSAATVTLVHAYDGVLSTVSRTAGQVALLLCAECSAEQAPVLDTDFCPLRLAADVPVRDVCAGQEWN